MTQEERPTKLGGHCDCEVRTENNLEISKATQYPKDTCLLFDSTCEAQVRARGDRRCVDANMYNALLARAEDNTIYAE